MILPWSVWDCCWLAPVALILDLMFGDPRLPWPHPVCVIGSCLHMAEKIGRRFAGKASSSETVAWREKFTGFLTLILLCSGAYVIVLCLEILPYVGAIFAIYFAWAGLAMGCLLDTGRIVLERVENEDLKSAREGVGWLVSRDVSCMARNLLRKTLADTLSENFTDAFLAPFFWLVITGPAGLWLYKTVSTMDSQWGYLTPRWRFIGYAGAKGDDVLAWLPARLAPAALFLVHTLAHIPGRFLPPVWEGHWPGYNRIRHDASGMPSPNSGWSMAACAWLCHGRMAGPSIYFGELVQKGWIGPDVAPDWDRCRLAALMRLMWLGTFGGAALVWFPCVILANL